MTAASSTDYLNGKPGPSEPVPWKQPEGLTLDAVLLPANTMAFKTVAGLLTTWAAVPSMVCAGKVQNRVDNSASAFKGIPEVEAGLQEFANAAGVHAVTAADFGHVIYASDERTLSRDDQGGTLPIAGICLGLRTPPNTTSAVVAVLTGLQWAALYNFGAARPFFARGVITSIAAYTAANGVLAANATGAIGAQDGLTLAAGDVVILPKVTGGAGGATTAANVGPYVVTTPGGTGVAFVLTRPWWWPQGGLIPQGRSIEVGGEGTVWAGIDWRALCAGALVVGTGDPLLYPRVQKGTGAVGTQVTGIFGRTNAAYSVMDTTAAHFVLPAFVAGNGTGTLDFTGTGTDATNYMVVNY